MGKLENESDLEYKQRVLDPISNSFCAAKWYNATIWLGSGMSTSCHHPPAHYVHVKDIELNPKALHNTEEKRHDRRIMKYGQRPLGCDYCWKIEDIGTDAVSDRVYKSVIYSDDDIQAAVNMPNAEDANLKTLEISFDRTCNFACSYCNPAFSTEWVKDIKQKGAYTNLLSDGRGHFVHDHDHSQRYKPNEDNPYVEAFFKWWESDLHETLQELRITGGEPLMSVNMWRLLDWFEENKGKSETRLAINSNLCNNKVQEFKQRTHDLEAIDLYTSCEAIGKQAEYIRDGLKWNEWKFNFCSMLERGNIRGMHVMCTINALCLESLTDFLEVVLGCKERYKHKTEVNFTLNILRFPSFQSPLVLPDDIKAKHKEKLEAWLELREEVLSDMERNHVSRLIDYLDVVKTPHDDAFELPALHNDFREFYKQYDDRRDKNFVETFPELAEWYKTL